MSVLAISTAILLADVTASAASIPSSAVTASAPVVETASSVAPQTALPPQAAEPVMPGTTSPIVSTPSSASAPAASPPTAAQDAASPIDPNTITVMGRPDSPADPLQDVNTVTYSATQSVDQAVIYPVSLAYKATVPSPLRSGVRNVLNNLQEPVVFLNFLLQHKIGKAAETLGRFAVNSTVGVAGVMDVAKKKPFHWPRRPNGFAFTLGYYGIKTGAFMFLPIIGPTTVRDLFGRWVDLLVMPTAIGAPFNNPVYSVSTVTFRALDERVENDETLSRLHNDNGDPYTAMREYYLQNRQNEIDELRGKHKTVGTPATAPVVPEKMALPVG